MPTITGSDQVDGKGNKDRVTILSTGLHADIKQQLSKVLALQIQDNKKGIGPSLPSALSTKYPNAFRQPAWMFLFPSSGICEHPDNKKICRHRIPKSLADTKFQQEIKSIQVRRFSRKLQLTFQVQQLCGNAF